MPEPRLPYNGVPLDRGPRDDPHRLEEIRRRPGTRVVALWRDRCLVRDGAPVTLTHPAEAVFLGMDGAGGVFAADLSELGEGEALTVAGASATADVRAMFHTLTADEAAILAYARGLLHWHRRQRFCGTCGGRTDSRNGGHARACPPCDQLLFPRIEPAVIVLVESAGRCLLGRHNGQGEGVYSTLAGFVEVGESLEETVRREVLEETGVRVGEVVYQASQAWPFPAGLMIGFRARAVSEAITVDPGELREARWFTGDEVRDLRATQAAPARGDSIEEFLIRSWLAAGPILDAPAASAAAVAALPRTRPSTAGPPA